MRDEENRWLAERGGCGDAYDAIYQQRAAAGEDVHVRRISWRGWEGIMCWTRAAVRGAWRASWRGAGASCPIPSSSPIRSCDG